MSKKPRAKTGGRKPGSRNKITLERERLARDAAAAELRKGLSPRKVSKKKADEVVKAVQADQIGVLKLGKTILSEFANVLAGMAAMVQPRTAAEIKTNSTIFRQYAQLAVYASEKAAQYESPRLAAMMIGQAQTKKVEIVGGLPAPTEQPVELPPDLYDDSEKVIDGHAERHHPNNAPDIPSGASPVLSSDERR